MCTGGKMRKHWRWKKENERILVLHVFDPDDRYFTLIIDNISSLYWQD